MGNLEGNSETWKTLRFSGFKCQVSGIGRVSIFGFGLFPWFRAQRPITISITNITTKSPKPIFFISTKLFEIWDCKDSWKLDVKWKSGLWTEVYVILFYIHSIESRVMIIHHKSKKLHVKGHQQQDVLHGEEPNLIESHFLCLAKDFTQTKQVFYLL